MKYINTAIRIILFIIYLIFTPIHFVVYIIRTLRYYDVISSYYDFWKTDLIEIINKINKLWK